jgi:hypothetical protein
MMSVTNVLTHDRLCRAMTGCTPSEFRALTQEFARQLHSRAWDAYRENPHRERRPGGGRKLFVPTPEEQLFFLLVYYKVYPTFDVVGFLYDRDRSRPCVAVHALTPVLEATLGKKLVLPKRQIRSVKEFFQAFPEATEIFLDGTERPIQRPTNAARQTANYSGKKKRHARKNLILSDRQKRIGYLSPTVEGKAHDFSILKDLRLPDHIPKDIRCRMDSGFQGFDNAFPGHAVSLPRKKPKGRPLCQTFKEQNRRKSRIRVLVEHAIGGTKRFRSVTDVFRNKRANADDHAMVIACGLWNYHLAYAS